MSKRLRVEGEDDDPEQRLAEEEEAEVNEPPSEAASAAKRRRQEPLAEALAAFDAVDVGGMATLSEADSAAAQALAEEEQPRRRRRPAALGIMGWVPAPWWDICPHCYVSGCLHPKSLLPRGHCICAACWVKYPSPGHPGLLE